MSYRVLYLDHADDMGGAEYSLVELILKLKESGIIDPIVATAKHGDFANYLKQIDIEVLPLEIPKKAIQFARERSGNPLSLFMQMFYWRKTLIDLKTWIKTNHVDLIHSNTLKMHVLASFLSRVSHVPQIWHVRDITSHRGNATRILKMASSVKAPEAIIAISRAVMEGLDGLHGNRITCVIHNGIEIYDKVNTQASHTTRQNLGLPVNAVLIASVGYFIPWKGQDILINAFSKLCQDHPDYHLVLIGKPVFRFKNEQKRLEALGKSLGISSRIHFLGEQKNIINKLQAFDLFVSPSTKEPFGRVILEAMLARVPIVATDAGGIPEIVQHEKEALLVPPSDPAALAQVMERLLSSPKLSQSLVKSAYEHVLAEFSLQKTVDQVLKVYKAILPDV